MKKSIVIAILAVLIGGSFAAANTIPAKQHFASFGPFCISKGPSNGERGGIMRAVATGQKCYSDERRIAHKRIPLNPGVGPRGYRGAKGTAGEVGLTGPTGAQGFPGKNGADGVAGKDGAKGDTGAQGAQGVQGIAGPKGDTGPAGSNGEGSVGPAGPQGETGTTGPQGATGPAGTNGLGNGTLVICLDGKGGINQAPCKGDQTPVTVVIVTS